MHTFHFNIDISFIFLNEYATYEHWHQNLTQYQKNMMNQRLSRDSLCMNTIVMSMHELFWEKLNIEEE